MPATDQDWLDGWRRYCESLAVKGNPETRWEQMVKFGYGVQWLVTGRRNSDDRGWAQRQLAAWGYRRRG
jgi:hypothetical protein